MCSEHGVAATPGGAQLVAVAEGGATDELLDAWSGRVREGASRLGGSRDGLVLARELGRLRDADGADPELSELLASPPPGAAGGLTLRAPTGRPG